MNRRGMLRLLTFGAVSAPAVGMASVKAESDPDKDGPICSETLQLKSGTKEKKKIAQYGDIGFYQNKYEEHKTINLSVGRDGELWLKKEDGKWKRIVTE